MLSRFDDYPIHQGADPLDDEALLVGYFQHPTGERWNADGTREPVSAEPEPTVDPDAPGVVILIGPRQRSGFNGLVDGARA
jgi:hypothetical protein